MEVLDFDVESIAHLLDVDTTAEEDGHNLLQQSSQQYPNTLSIVRKDLSEEDGLEGFNRSLGETWIYPTNYSLREYQYKIVHEALFKNTFVALPTGLGKTFIAAVVIYNMYRWYPQAKIVFMAPTKPLVAQQITACMDIASIPKDDIAEITGKQAIKLRKNIWQTKRVFFITPQVLQNDLAAGHFPVSKLRLLVIDEAHHTRGKYSYAEVVKTIQEIHSTFRILALTATPAKNIQDVIEIIKLLQINHLEIRSDDSKDVKQYMHKKDIQTVIVRLDPLIRSIKEKYISIVDTYIRRLFEMQVLRGTAGNLSKGQVVLQYKKYQSEAALGKRHPQHTQIVSDFTMCISLIHGLDLLVSHGYRVFLNYFDGSHNKGWLFKEARLQRLIQDLHDRIGSFDLNITLPDGDIRKPEKEIDYGHPKFKHLGIIVKKHFDENDETRCIVFCEYRESVQLVHSLLLGIGEPIKPQVFMGTGVATAVASNTSPAPNKFKSLTQKQQLIIMEKFRTGKCNVLISTCIAEEGMDVGEVDLIVCFDTSTKNPTRLVQRMGRTGRKRAGKVVLLVTEGKEETVLMQSMLEKNTLTNRIENSREIKEVLRSIQAPRMVPHDLQPECRKMYLAPPKEPEVIATEGNKKGSKATKAEKNKKATTNKKQPDLREMFSKQIEKNKTPVKKKSNEDDTSPSASPVQRNTRLTKRKSNDLRRYIQVTPKKKTEISQSQSSSKSNDVPVSQDDDVFEVPVDDGGTKSKEHEAMDTDSIVLPNDSIYAGQNIPASLADYITKINSDNIKNLLKDDCDFCENIMKFDNKPATDGNIGKLDFLKEDFVAPNLDWIRNLKNEPIENEIINEEPGCSRIHETDSQLLDGVEILTETFCDYPAFHDEPEIVHDAVKNEARNSARRRLDLVKDTNENTSNKTNAIIKHEENKSELMDNTSEVLSYFKLSNIEDIVSDSVKLTETAKSSQKSDICLTPGESAFFKLDDIAEIFEDDFGTADAIKGTPDRANKSCIPSSCTVETSPIFNRKKRSSVTNRRFTQNSTTHSTPKSEHNTIKNTPKTSNPSVMWDDESLLADTNLELNITETNKTENRTESLVSVTQMLDLINASERQLKVRDHNKSKIESHTVQNSPATAINPVPSSPVTSKRCDSAANVCNQSSSSGLNVASESFTDAIPATPYSPVKSFKNSRLNLGRLKSLQINKSNLDIERKTQASSPYFQKSQSRFANIRATKTDDKQLDDKINMRDTKKVDLNKSTDSDATFVDVNELELLETLRDVDVEEDMDTTNVSGDKTKSTKALESSATLDLSSFKYAPKRIEFPDSDDDVFQNIPSTFWEPVKPNKNKENIVHSKKAKRKNVGGVSQFLDCEANMSGDEADHYEDSFEEEDMKSFIDFGSQELKDQTDMTAKYLQSVRSPLKLSGFKVPQAVPPKRRNLNVFSQIPEPDITSYAEDSFCVYDEPTVYEHELSELEILEKKLKKSRKQSRKRKRLKSISDDEVKADDVIEVVDSDEDSFMPKITKKKLPKRSKRIINVISSSSEESA